MKRLFTSVLAVAAIMSTLTVPALAVDTVIPEDGLKASLVNGYYVVTVDRYNGPDYDATLSEMDTLRDEAHATGTEIGVPDTLFITADTVEDAEDQLEYALDYAPDHIEVTLTCQSEAKALYDKYTGWQGRGEGIPVFINTIETMYRTPVEVKRSGNTVTFTVHYNDGWLAYVDLQDWLRVYEDEDYSEALVAFAETYLEPIAQQDMSQADRVWAVRNLIMDITDYDYKALRDMESSYSRYTNISCHNLYGMLDDGLLVCDGYAVTVNFMLSYFGMDSFAVRYNTGYRMSHIWNKVCVDGIWYNLDMTTEQTVADEFGVMDDTGFFLTTDDALVAGSYKPLASWYETCYPCNDFYGYQAT